MKPAIIFGNENFAEMLADYMKSVGLEVFAFCVNEKYINKDQINGINVLPFENIAEYCPPSEYDFYLAIGYKKMAKTRAMVLENVRELGYATPNFVHPSVVVAPKIDIGYGNIFFQNVSIGYKVKIGNGNLFFDNSIIGHNTEICNFNTFSVGAKTCGFSKIENHCFIGAGSCIRDHVRVSNYNFIGAQTFISKDTNENQVFSHNSTKLLEKDSMSLREVN